jgi:hypothetical protein
MSNKTVGAETVKQAQFGQRREVLAHPALKANLLMGAVVLVLLILTVASTLGGR